MADCGDVPWHGVATAGVLVVIHSTVGIGCWWRAVIGAIGVCGRSGRVEKAVGTWCRRGMVAACGVAIRVRIRYLLWERFIIRAINQIGGNAASAVTVRVVTVRGTAAVSIGGVGTFSRCYRMPRCTGVAAASAGAIMRMLSERSWAECVG